jgi:hypothetical protein
LTNSNRKQRVRSKFRFIRKEIYETFIISKKDKLKYEELQASDFSEMDVIIRLKDSSNWREREREREY